jgi:hypothetical protein
VIDIHAHLRIRRHVGINLHPSLPLNAADHLIQGSIGHFHRDKPPVPVEIIHDIRENQQKDDSTPLYVAILQHFHNTSLDPGESKKDSVILLHYRIVMK